MAKVNELTNLVDGGTYLACEDHTAEATNAGTSSDWRVKWHYETSLPATRMLCDYCQNLDPKL